MDTVAFWDLIDTCGPAGDDYGARLARKLISHLSQGPVEDIVAFAEQLSEVMANLGRAPLRHDLDGGDFLFQRAAVVAAGRVEYERVIEDPARLADFKERMSGHLLLVPDRAYQQFTGHEWRRGHRYSYEYYYCEAGDLPPEASDDDIIAAVRERVAGRDLPPPASEADVAAFERRVGHPMPTLLRRLYLEVANGGFGIWECVSLTSVDDRWFSDVEDLTVAYEAFQTLSDDPDHEPVPKGAVPLMDRGCNMWTVLDFGTPQGRIWDWDPHDCCAFTPTTLAFADWIRGWLEGWIVPGSYRELRVHPASCPKAGQAMSPEEYREREVFRYEP
ncbi:DUF4240 domain-containing protein [Streptomyces smaragdinus]|nr:DUF4240 domain-containing protein [Streptomyces smaragdinus]